MSNLLQKASIITTSTAYDTGKILSVKPVQYYGPEQVTGFTNGTTYPFSTFTTLDNNITSAIINSNFAGCVSNSISVTSFQIYKVSFNYIKNSGNDLRVVFSSVVSGAGLQTSNNELVSTSGSITLYLTISSSGTSYLQLGTASGSASIDFSISNVSVKEVFNADFDFTRNSSATRVGSNGLIQDVASNLPRIDYTGGVGSWKFEPQSTNVVPYSENFSHSSWLKNDVTIQSGYIAPDGTNSAYKVTKIGSNAHLVNTITGGNTATKSIFAKTTSGTGTIILFNNVITYFTITEEWQRFDIQHNGLDFFYAADFRGASTLTEIIIWGAQSEALSYPTSYIRSNSGSATTRLADVANNAGSSDLINSSEGVLYAEISALANDATTKAITISQASNNLLGFYYYQSRIDAYVRVNGVNQFSTTYYLEPTINNKISLKYKTDSFALWVNGFEVATDTSGNLPSGLNQLRFDDLSDNFYGNTKSVAVFKEALTDLELECLVSWMSFSDLGINFGYTVE